MSSSVSAIRRSALKCNTRAISNWLNCGQLFANDMLDFQQCLIFKPWSIGILRAGALQQLSLRERCLASNGARSGGKFVMSRKREACHAQGGGPNRRFKLE